MDRKTYKVNLNLLQYFTRETFPEKNTGYKAEQRINMALLDMFANAKKTQVK